MWEEADSLSGWWLEEDKAWGGGDPSRWIRGFSCSVTVTYSSSSLAVGRRRYWGQSRECGALDVWTDHNWVGSEELSLSLSLSLAGLLVFLQLRRITPSLHISQHASETEPHHQPPSPGGVVCSVSGWSQNCGAPVCQWPAVVELVSSTTSLTNQRHSCEPGQMLLFPGLFLRSESRDWTVSMMSWSLQFKWTPERERGREGGGREGESSEPVVFMEPLKMKQHGGREMRGSDSDS